MLAQNFMKPEALGVSRAEWSALAAVLGMLERGELCHGNEAVGQAFCMSATFAKDDCGTIGCIGGYVAMLMGESSPDDYICQYRDSGALTKLYFPRKPDGGLLPTLYQVTTEQAAIALRNFLATGEPDWREAISVANT